MTDLLAELKAALADTYEVESELGEGGMALVFLARDLKHDRQVAIKILKPELAANLGADRFLREIQITAKLSHPHVLPLYDSGVAAGYLYYVMPFVEGEPLSNYLEREKQLPIEEALKIAREVAEALAYAHSYGLVHRDIKPDNVFLSRGHAIVADFGIARAVSSAGGDQLTQTGMAVGTPAYMSPEQAAGDPNVDGRTDVYSLGCVLYEMLVGDIPFTGPNAMAIMARHSMDMITAPHIMRQSIPEEIEDVIYKAMAKTPADRFRTAQDMVDAIQAVERGGPSAPSGVARLSQMQRMSQARRGSQVLAVPVPAWRKYLVPGAAAVVLAGVGIGAWQLVGGSGSGTGLRAAGLDPSRLAVLYFRDLSRDSSLGHLADAFTEELIHQLDAARLDIRSPDAVASFRNARVPPDSVGRALDVGTIVDGAFELEGNDVSVSVRLYDGGSGTDLVEGRTNLRFPIDQARQLQDSLVRVVADNLKRRVGNEVRLQEQRARATSDASWTLVQRAERLRKDGQRAFADQRVDEGLRLLASADSMLVQAEALDPEWVEPIVLRARLAYDRIRPDRQRRAAWVQEAIAHANRALAKQPGHARALEWRGATRFLAVRANLADNLREQEGLLEAARRDLDSALAADQSLASAYSTLSHLHMYRGEKLDAALKAQRAYEEDAYLDVADEVLSRLFWANYDLNKLTDAERWCETARRRFPEDPRFAECRLMLMASPGGQPDVATAWELAADMVRHAAARDTAFNRSLGQTIVGGVLAQAGLRDSAERVLAEARPAPGIDAGGTIAFTEAYARILLGDNAGAVERLKRYLLDNPEQHHGLRSGGELYWWWMPLRGDPEFELLAAGR